MLRVPRLVFVVCGLAAATLLVACARGLSAGEQVITLYVAPQQVDCQGEAPMKCLLVRTRPDEPWTRFYDEIEGFRFEPGFHYTLRVARRTVADPPADASSLAYRLIEVVEKRRAAN